MNDNKIKALNGSRSKSSLVALLKELQDNHTILCCHSDYRCGYENMNSEQFFSPFLIEFSSGNNWLVFSTNSIRNDRVSIQQWNAENIKRINMRITKAIIVIPDDTQSNDRERKEVEKYKKKITSNDFYSAIDDVIYQSELVDYIVSFEK